MFDIEKRLEKLEKSNRKMKSIALVATLACVGFMTIAATPRGVDEWFDNLFVTETLVIEPGGIQYIDSGTLNLDEGTMNLNEGTMNLNEGTMNLYYGHLDLHGSNQHIYNGSLNIDGGGSLNIDDGHLDLHGSNQHIDGGSLYIDYGNLNLHNTDQFIHYGNLSIDSGTLNIHYGSLNIDGGDLNVTDGAIHIDGENLSHVLEDLQVQINSLQEELMECCGAVATCPSDLNDDENVNVHDLLQLISEWGACS